jgi:hypothetical protein
LEFGVRFGVQSVPIHHRGLENLFKMSSKKLVWIERV